MAALKAGVSIPLTCGANLEVQYIKSQFVGVGIQVRLNGVPVAGSMLSPTYLLRTLGKLFLIFGVLQMASALSSFSNGKSAGLNLYGVIVLLSGIANVPLAVFCFSGKRWAGLAGVITYVSLFSIVLSFVLFADVARTHPVALIVPVIVIIALIRTTPSKEMKEWEDGLDAQFQGAEIFPVDGFKEYPIPLGGAQKNYVDAMYGGAAGASLTQKQSNAEPVSDFNDDDVKDELP
ncbi:MAG: hypothetical protein KDB07_04510, partial [Planctomycetes bacterium]|nr:hypothetical protein [Planctomycetota bacterium]